MAVPMTVTCYLLSESEGNDRGGGGRRWPGEEGELGCCRSVAEGRPVLLELTRVALAWGFQEPRAVA